MTYNCESASSLNYYCFCRIASHSYYLNLEFPSTKTYLPALHIHTASLVAVESEVSPILVLVFVDSDREGDPAHRLGDKPENDMKCLYMDVLMNTRKLECLTAFDETATLFGSNTNHKYQHRSQDFFKWECTTGKISDMCYMLNYRHLASESGARALCVPPYSTHSVFRDDPELVLARIVTVRRPAGPQLLSLCAERYV